MEEETSVGASGADMDEVKWKFAANLVLIAANSNSQLTPPTAQYRSFVIGFVDAIWLIYYYLNVSCDRKWSLLFLIPNF